LIETVVGICNTTGAEVDKFEHFALTAKPATHVKTPLIEGRYANFECKWHDAKMLDRYNFFIFEVVKANVTISPKCPRTMHCRGYGIFMVSIDAILQKYKT
jgi:flavin reductase (DIM6/NTAB) family NADH-FMN oxidoreductase RutF